jgi:hypothetical protein
MLAKRRQFGTLRSGRTAPSATCRLLSMPDLSGPCGATRRVAGAAVELRAASRYIIEPMRLKCGSDSTSNWMKQRALGSEINQIGRAQQKRRDTFNWIDRGSHWPNDAIHGLCQSLASERELQQSDTRSRTVCCVANGRCPGANSLRSRKPRRL